MTVDEMIAATRDWQRPCTWMTAADAILALFGGE